MDHSSMFRGFVSSVALGAALAGPGVAHAQAGKVDPDGLTPEMVRSMMSEYFHPGSGNGRVQPADIPDVFGPGAVLRVGNIHMKVTNWGHCGNLFTNVSSDPSAQWPGESGVEYLSSIRLAVGGVNPTATDPNSVRRVSYLLEWRPETLDPVDKIYRAYDGIVNGNRFVNDDGDRDPDPFAVCDHDPPCPLIDEDFLDGRDNDGDGRIDEDYAAVGQEMYSCVMWDNTVQAINSVFNEKHVPLGLECRQSAWAYSVIGFQDFNVIQYQIYNRSGHTLDSVYVGWLVDMDCGPLMISNFFGDDVDVPTFPQGEYYIHVGGSPGDFPDPALAQKNHSSTLFTRFPRDSSLCPVDTVRINGFSVVDDNGDNGKTPGVGSFLLVDHTTDPTGATGPTRVGFRAYRSFTGSTPYAQGGNPVIDEQRYEFMSSTEHIGDDGFVDALPGDQKGDQVAWCSIGPYRNLANGQSITATVAFAVQNGDLPHMAAWPARYQRYRDAKPDQKSALANQLFADYPALRNAFDIQVAFQGVHEKREGFAVPDFHGRETMRTVKPGEPPIFLADCRDQDSGNLRQVNEHAPAWFDFDCSYCTGVWDPTNGGYFHKTWNAEAPPPNPNANLSNSYNYTDNPDRKVVPAGDRKVTVAWDNLSEVTPDPKSRWLDFRGYRLWKVSDWRRPVGSAGPSESDWTLLGEFRRFDYYDVHGSPIPNNMMADSTGHLSCPRVFFPNYLDPRTGNRGPATVEICLNRGDLWDRQSGQVIRPDTSNGLGCVRDTAGNCIAVTGCIVGRGDCDVPNNNEVRERFPVGVYRFVDHEVKNGFIYFYSVTAFDSTTTNDRTTELGGRRSAVEAEGVVPQASVTQGKGVWVVPNPYRGYANIPQRPSSWDLTPNASDPTGTHIDFLGLPAGKWTIKIFTVSGDLVAELRSDDAVNESLRPPVSDTHGVVHAGYNRQQDNPNDGQARWNLISRNGQDIVSGIYIFTVQSSEGTQRGRFVVIR